MLTRFNKLFEIMPMYFSTITFIFVNFLFVRNDEGINYINYNNYIKLAVFWLLIFPYLMNNSHNKEIIICSSNSEDRSMFV